MARNLVQRIWSKEMKITCTNPNKKNGFKDSRITIKTDKKEIVDQFFVPSRNAIKYCQEHPTGKHGKRFAEAVEKAKKMDLQNKEDK